MLRLASVALMMGLCSSVLGAESDWAPVAKALGRSGTEMPGGVYRVGLGRSDLKVTLDGVQIKPTLALGSYLAFQKMGGDDAMVMGDLVLLHEEVNPVMKKLVDGGIEITALHNHLLRSSPATMYMHFLGHGDPAKLAVVLRTALAESKTPLAAPAAAGSPPPLEMDTAAIERTLGAKGTANAGVLGFNIARAENVVEDGMPLPIGMGSGIVINFQPTGSGRAAITGDFVLVAKEVNPVLKTLRDNGIEVTALHSHMLEEQPRMFFMHFWANDDAQKLASGLKAALGKVNLSK
jgi:hypothetical protein